MIPRLQVILRDALVFLLAGSVFSEALATSWDTREDLGVAAVERQTGKVLWEAWQRDDIPAGVSKAEKAAVEKLLTQSPRYLESDLIVEFPLALTKTCVVNQVYEEPKFHLILSDGRPDAIGAEIARFSFEAEGYQQYARAGETLYLLVNGKLHAFQATTKEGPADKRWKPLWTFDLSAALPEQERKSRSHIPTWLRANTEGAWLIHGSQIRQFTPQGRLQALYEIKNAWWSRSDFPRCTLVFGKRLVYYCHNFGVIAFDRQSKKELWRLETKRFPYASRVVEVGKNRLFVQMGSDVPHTIKSALGIAQDPFPKLPGVSMKQRVVAAMLLHSYGEGYLRPQLRKYLEELRKAKDDAEAKKAAVILDNLLATWPRKRERQRLLDTCITALLQVKKKDSRQAFALPANQRLLMWCLLQELIYRRAPDAYDQPGVNFAYDIGCKEQRLSLDDKKAARLVEHCRQVVATGSETEKPFAASVLVSQIGWKRLSEDELKKLFLSRQLSVWRWTAMSLSENGQREKLIRWAPERPAGDLADILFILAQNMPKKWSASELDFWLSCARRTPSRVAYVLNLEFVDKIPLVFRAPIRSYLEKEIAKPTVLEGDKQEASDLMAALVVLDHWKNPADTPLLLKYLKHPCRSKFSVSRGGDEYRDVWSYWIRGRVRNMLEERGVIPQPLTK